jgi:hypothetical protein
MKNIKTYISFFYLFFSFLFFKFFNRNIIHTHLFFVRLHCFTNGKSTDFFSKIISKLKKKIKLEELPITNLIYKLSNEEINNFITKIEKESYVIYPYKLGSEIIDDLYQFSCQNSVSEIANNIKQDKIITYQKKSQLSERLDFFKNDLIKNNYVQNLICDSTILNICQNYFNAAPVFAEANMWWTIANKYKPSVEGAQLYHFDLDATKWLKIFIYLTDVDINSGPHCYVEGTHKCHDQSRDLLSKGYVRIEDDDIIKTYSIDKCKTITGSKGTIIFGDTRAFHKGMKPNSRDRLILELTYINSNFAYNDCDVKLSNLDLKSVHLKEYISKTSIFKNIEII